jgi:spore germination cell wall hydrolase CwlJ-like protein
VSAYPRSACRLRAIFVLAATGLVLAGCQTISKTRNKIAAAHMSSRDCLARAMYFESNRSSDDGMLAVGTVVMNRVEAKKYGPNVCHVVGAKNQFAPGVLTRSMTEGKSKERAYRAADRVLGGKRHPKVGKAEFFHTANYEPGYNNMRYVSIEGGNAFYEKVRKGEDTGHLVRIARQGPKSIGDMVALQETTMVAAQPVAVPPPADEPVYAPPQRAYMPPPHPAPVYSAAPQTTTPAAAVGWQAGPPGRMY